MRGSAAVAAVHWEMTNLWGMVELALANGNGTSRHTLGQFKANSKGCQLDLATVTGLPDGPYFFEVRSKRWPLVYCQVGPIHLMSNVNVSSTTRNELGSVREAKSKTAGSNLQEGIVHSAAT